MEKISKMTPQEKLLKETIFHLDKLNVNLRNISTLIANNGIKDDCAKEFYDMGKAIQRLNQAIFNFYEVLKL